MKGQTFFDGEKEYRVSDLYALVEGQEPIRVRLDQLDDFDHRVWLDTSRDPDADVTADWIIEHADRIKEANLDYPILLTPDHTVVDGWHRLCKARILRHTTIEALVLPEFYAKYGKQSR